MVCASFEMGDELCALVATVVLVVFGYLSLMNVDSCVWQSYTLLIVSQFLHFLVGLCKNVVCRLVCFSTY